MNAFDRVLLAVLGIGVWTLIAVTLTSSSVQAGTQELSRYDVEDIVEDCTVSGDVNGEVYMYNERNGELEGAQLYRGRIRC